LFLLANAIDFHGVGLLPKTNTPGPREDPFISVTGLGAQARSFPARTGRKIEDSAQVTENVENFADSAVISLNCDFFACL
jgi:hypothetical protein